MKDREELIEAALDYGVDIVGRRVFLHGDVGEDTIGIAIRGLYMLSDKKVGEPIELYVSSYGGELDEAFALHDVTRTIRSPVHTIALGKCMSAAPMLVACGTPGSRFATENTTFMLHDAELSPAGANADNILANANITKSMMDRYATLLARYSKKDKRFWKKVFSGKVDMFFGAQQALEWGLIDMIWSEKD